MTQVLAITGGRGFLGRHLVAEYARRGTFSLRLLTRDPQLARQVSSDRIAVHVGDLLRPETLSGFLEPNVTLIHLAYSRDDDDANVAATVNLVRAAKQLDVKRIVHCSTAVVVGFDAKGVITEDTVARPRGPYQEVKYRIEQLLLEQLPPAVELAILRPTHIMGPGGTGLQSMIRRLREHRAISNSIYHFLLKSRRFNYVSVHNVVAALILLATAPIAPVGDIYNVSDDDDPDNTYAAIEEIIAACLDLGRARFVDLGLPRPVVRALFKLLPHHSPPDRVYSCAKLSALGYRQAMSLRGAISELVRSESANAHP